MNAVADRGQPAAEFPVQVLREYSIIADGERGAELGPRGDIVWMCAPQWHDDAVFSSLIGGRGCYSITPRDDRYVWGGSYEAGTLIWRSRWVTTDSIIESREALLMPGDPHRAVVLRRIEALRETAKVRIQLDVRGGFGRRSMRKLHRSDDGTWTALTGDLRVRWTGAASARTDSDGRLVLDLDLAEGQTHDLVLELGDGALGDPVDPTIAWAQTEHQWAEHVPDLHGTVAPRDAQLACAVLRGLTSSRGGMVAAATMSLPERSDDRRNYDYRYAWIRDTCYAGIAAASAGVPALLDDAVSFVVARVLDAGDALAPATLVGGGRVPDERTIPLPGYPGGRDVAGNRANDQFQLDSLGEVLQLLAHAAELDRLDADGWQAIQVGIGVIEKRWTAPDAGIWELEDDWWTQSRLSCVAGLRAAAAVAPSAGDAGTIVALADAILAETTRRCLHTEGYWQRSPTRPGVDASLVLPPVRGAVAASDPRTRATLAAVEKDLTVDYYAYRFAHDVRELGEAEGAFLLCGFQLCLAYLHQGNAVEAFRWFERTRASCGSPGLFTEEYEIDQRQLRGNLPQAFVHATMLECASRLSA
jgi:GH15 family glucan-1,4-alpha-glucosidase